ncbi:hypothetical protein C2W59_00399 [Bacillus pumilus]|uniref:hypothetical protein n=1 Tax=Bacillus pumilus TaxID=1408 RepID=UPI000DC404F3|nr:hypothetical protein [Bacillus pumilus]RAP25437.1 hypothetical protein C2W59_00399 [Bacillus pumilus]
MKTYSYDPEKKKWEKKSSLDYIVSAGTLNEIDGKLYLSGGTESLNKMIGEYDPDTDTWIKKQGGWSAGYYATAVYNSKVLLTGGTARLSVHDVILGTGYSVQTPKTFYRKGHSAALSMILFISLGEKKTQMVICLMQKKDLNLSYQSL